MALEIKVEELENGFRFDDAVTEITVVKEDEAYLLRWITEGKETITVPLPSVATPKEAYGEFRESISAYWLQNLGLFFEMNNLEKIEELFRPLAKYQ